MKWHIPSKKKSSQNSQFLKYPNIVVETLSLGSVEKGDLYQSF